MPVELRQLRYAIAAADHRSFRRAAEALNLKQSTLSRRIRQLEERLNLVLFERSHAGVHLTAGGSEFLRAARHIIEEIDAMAASAIALGSGKAGGLSIGFYTSLSAGNLRATLIDFGKRFPDVGVRFVDNSRAQLLAAVKSRSIDIAIVTGELGDRSDGNVMMPLWNERIIVALSGNHSLASSQSVSWSDLKNEIFLLQGDDFGQDFQALLMAKLASPGSQPRIVKHEADSEAIKSLVGAGLGVGLLCEAFVGASHTDVIYREIRDGSHVYRIGYTAYWHLDNDSPALGSFVKILRERYPELSERLSPR